MRLFAANVTSQAYEFHYRMPEDPRTLHVSIPSGEQRAIGRDMTVFEANHLIQINSIYGMLEVDKVDTIERGKTVTLIFSRDKEVPAELIQQVFAYNRGEITEIGRQRREEVAVAATKVLGTDQIAERASVSMEEDGNSTVSNETGVKLQEGYAAPDSTIGRQRGFQPKGKR